MVPPSKGYDKLEGCCGPYFCGDGRPMSISDFQYGGAGISLTAG